MTLNAYILSCAVLGVEALQKETVIFWVEPIFFYFFMLQT